MEAKKEYLGNELKNYLEEVKKNPEYVRDKTPLERLFQMIPNSMSLDSLKNVPLLVRDYFSKWPSFASVLYCQLDYQNLILYILFYTLFFKVTGNNSMVAIGIVYLIEKFLITLRAWLGERNLSIKTLTDSRFLV